jgi:sulfur carrier protein ThiS adenylyltransferase
MTFDQIRKTLSTKTVGIAGCGGLGSNCAVALARSGVGHLIIADFDIISESNLNRQFYFYHQVGLRKAPTLKENIAMVNPGVKVTVFDEKITGSNLERIFLPCDIVVEAFDLASEKQMLIEEMSIRLPGVPVVAGLGMAGFGNSNAVHCRLWEGLYICGDGVTEISVDCPPMAPRVGMVANMQANVVVALLMGEEGV